MAQMAERSRTSGAVGDARPGETLAASRPASAESVDRDKVLPLPTWLRKAYFIFPIVLYIPDAIFNFYVYSDGGSVKSTNPLVQAGFVALWGFLAIGVVGMAYLLSVLAPWHWGQGHRIQAFFCGLGVVIATGITTWCSLAYRSIHFQDFVTDKWVYSVWPQLQTQNISLTMILVAIAPPFWGLFWAIVQPTQTGRSLRQLQESHAERLMRMQQEAELKRLRAETNAKIREAQLRGMAQTAATAREQASGLFGQLRKGHTQAASPSAGDSTSADGAAAPGSGATTQPMEQEDEQTGERPVAILRYPTLQPGPGHDNGARASFMNSIAAAPPTAHAQPTNSRPLAAQQPMFGAADVAGSAGQPTSDTTTWEPRRPPTLGAVFAENGDADAMTGTSGPRHAIRRPIEMSQLTRGLGELRPAYVQAVQESIRELNPTGKKRISHAELTTLVAGKLDVEEAIARQIIARYREAQRNTRA